MDIVALDPFDDAMLEPWHATYFASTTHGRTHPTPWMLEEFRAQLRADDPGERTLVFAGLLDGAVASSAIIWLPLKDNTTMAWAELHVLPAMRNQGIGSVMLEHLTTVAREHGRTVLAAEAAFPYDAPADGAGHPDVEFLRRRGFTFGIGDVQRVLDLPVDERRLRDMVDSAAPYHSGYEIRSFVGPVPEDILASYGDLVGSLMVEAPAGEMSYEREVYDEERVRANEAMAEASGRTRYTTIAVAPDASVVAYTELVVPAHDPGRVYQWGTLVAPGHRGHRLGAALKARNLLWLQQERPDLTLLVTYNAEVNAHMVAVNDAMGFRPVERLGEFQCRLA